MRNRPINYIHNIYISKNQLLELAANLLSFRAYTVVKGVLIVSSCYNRTHRQCVTIIVIIVVFVDAP